MTWRERTYSKALGDLSSLEYDSEAQIFESSKDRLGWHIQQYRDLIAQEASGHPEPQGKFNKMKEVLAQGRLVNRRLLRVYMDSQGPLLGRNLLLVTRVFGIPLRFGVRIARVFDEEVGNIDGHREHVWGYTYRSLKGHYDIGEVSFRISKDLTSGHLFFAIETCSKTSRIPQFWYRWAFRIFGPGVQRVFCLNAIRRMRRLIARHESHETRRRGQQLREQMPAFSSFAEGSRSFPL